MEIHGKRKKISNFSKIPTYNARRDTFTFLKSNYKYKRRGLQHRCLSASEWRRRAISTTIAPECNSINKVISNTSASNKWRKCVRGAIAALLRMLLRLIISNSRLLQTRSDKRRNLLYHTASMNGNIDDGRVAATIDVSTSNDDVNVDGDEMDFQRVDVKVWPTTTTTTPQAVPMRQQGDVPPMPMSSPRPSWPSSPSSLFPLATHNGVARISDKPFTFLVALFIAFALCARSAAAGACWQTALDTGKCSEVYSLNITKAECCGRSSEFSFTEKDLTEVEYFFATAIGGGMECAPCMESCKGMQCGGNKKCVKRKGRPKCICAPKCGAAARRRRKQEEQSQQQFQLERRKHYRGHLHHSEQLPRDIRSLSSEITNFNLGLDTSDNGDASSSSSNSGTDIGIVAKQAHRRNQNQRKMLILQSQEEQHNHHHLNHQEQRHQRPEFIQTRSQPVKTGKRIVIIGNAPPSTGKEPSTRRVPIIGNVMTARKSEAENSTLPSQFSTEIVASMVHKSNANKNQDKMQQILEKNQIHRKNSNISCNNESDVNQNHNNTNNSNCNTSIRLRHTHQHINGVVATNPNRTALTLDAVDNVGGHDNDHDDHVASDKHQRDQRRRKAQRQRKDQEEEGHQHPNQKQQQQQQHHRHRFHNRQELNQHQDHHQHYHQHRHRSKQYQKQKMQLEKQQQKQRLKDRRHQKQQLQEQQQYNKTTMTTLMLPENSATSFSPALATTLYTSSASTAKTTTAIQNIRNINPQQQAPLAQTATPANSATSLSSATPGTSTAADHHYSSNRGSIFTTSSSMQLPSTYLRQQQSVPASNSPSKSTLPSSVGEVAIGGTIVGVSSNSPTTTISDFSLLDEIYDNSHSHHGFSNQGNEDMNYEIIHQHSTHPVCGTDGRTYNTECQLKKRACRTNNSNLQVAYRGHCKTSCNGVKCLNGLTCVEDHYMKPHCIACKIECPQDYGKEDIAVDDTTTTEIGDSDGETSPKSYGIAFDPSRAVCGVDGKTYRSVCDINRMVCKIGRSIAVAYPGPCRGNQISCSDIYCGPKHKCLIDLLTLEPRCVSCRYKCSRKHHPTDLRYEQGKICGVNNRTYRSWCEMRRDSCLTGFFIDVKAAGQCMSAKNDFANTHQ